MDKMLDFKALPMVEGEPVDVSKKVTNIDNEDFDFTYEKISHTIKAGETVTYPKYKVLFVAHHLARKIVKREAIAAFKKEFPTHHMGRADVKIRNEEREKELQLKIVAANFSQEVKEEPIVGNVVELKKPTTRRKKKN